MRKVIFLFILVINILLLYNNSVFAVNIDRYTLNSEQNHSILIDDETEYYDDGSYTEYKTYLVENNNALSSNLGLQYNKTGERIVTNYDAKNNVQWIYTLTAEYLIEDGVSVVCVNARYSTTIYNNNWKFSDGSSSYSSNTAYGNGKFTHKILFITTKTITIDIVLSCDKYGNLS